MKKKWILIIIILVVVLMYNQKKISYTNFSGHVHNYMLGNTPFQEFIQTSNYWVGETGTVTTDYDTYFILNPKVKARTLDIFSQQTETYFWDYINDLENNIDITVPEPESLTNCNFGQSCYMYFSQEDKDKIMAAKSAHAVWLDKNNVVSWNLEDYSDEDLDYILSWDYMMESPISIIDYNPFIIYSFTDNFIRNTKENTAYALLDDYRGTFVHYSSSAQGEWWGTVSLNHVLTTLHNGHKVAGGCGHMSLVISMTMRNLNIPAYHDGGYFANGHSSAFIRDIGIVNHGDDIYSGGLKDTPTSEMLMPWDYFWNYVEPCGKATNCSSYWTVRYSALRKIQYPTNIVINACCYPETTFYDDCDDYLVSNGYVSSPSPENGNPIQVVTDQELQDFKDYLLSMCGTQSVVKKTIDVLDCGVIPPNNMFHPTILFNQCDFEYSDSFFRN